MKKYILFFFTIIVGLRQLSAQELNCQVKINYSQIQGSVNKQIFDQLEKSIYEFMNNTNKWTTNVFNPQEKIECSMLIVVNQTSGSDAYSGSIQVICSRPVYKSAYKSQILNIQDDYFQFKFQQFTVLDFDLNKFDNNLTSVLAYYAYVILAIDADTFAPLGGTEYWQKAQIVVQNAQGASEVGWQSSQQGQRNRYWLVENTLQPLFKGIRDCMYDYHRKGLDIMFEKPDEGRAAVLKSLELLRPVYQLRPGSYVMQQFSNAKRDELVNIFKGPQVSPEEKTKAIDVLTYVDPANTTRYSKIQE
jgi:hypothetical protein